MTRAEIISEIRSLVNETSTDAGAKLSDSGNLLEFINDAAEQVVLELMRFMPEYFTAVENVSLVANQANYSLSAEFWMIYKVEKNVTNENPIPIDIITPNDKAAYMYVGETAADPEAVYFLGNTLYCVPTPSTTKTNYLSVHYIRPEATTIATGGPLYIPRPAHRLIVYKAAMNIAVMSEASPAPFAALYGQRVEEIKKTWQLRFQQRPRFVRPSYAQQIASDSREKAFYDWDWID